MNCDKIATDKNCHIIVNDDNFNLNYVKVFILKHNKTEKTQIIIKTSESQSVIFDMISDGFYTLCELQVPIDEKSFYYYKNNKFYHSIHEVCLQELLEVNPQVSQLNTKYYYYFSLCNLKRCFIYLCNEIYNQSSQKCNNIRVDKNLLYKRDLLLSALNVITYLNEFDQYEESQRLLDEITSCNGLCPQTYQKCGCQN